MNAYFAAHWLEWLNELQIPDAGATSNAQDQQAIDKGHFGQLKAQQLTALQTCLDFHLTSFPAGSQVDIVCEELNRGRFYSLETARPDSQRVRRQATGSVFKDVLLAHGCWLEQAPDFHQCQLYRERFRETYYFDWSDWIGQKPHGLEYLNQRGNRYFNRFCGIQPVTRRKWPYIRDYGGRWDMKTHLALLSHGDYKDFLSKSRLEVNSESINNAATSEQSADFENDECCQRAAKKLISAINQGSFGTLTNDEMSLLYLFLLGEDEPHQVLARITEQPADQFLAQYHHLHKRISTEIKNSIRLHQHRCPCWGPITRNHQSRGRCRCLAYMLHREWYAVTHQKLFRGRDQQMLTNFAQHCEVLLNRQRP
jgi:hypothetical protein